MTRSSYDVRSSYKRNYRFFFPPPLLFFPAEAAAFLSLRSFFSSAGVSASPRAAALRLTLSKPDFGPLPPTSASDQSASLPAMAYRSRPASCESTRGATDDVRTRRRGASVFFYVKKNPGKKTFFVERTALPHPPRAAR